MLYRVFKNLIKYFYTPEAYAVKEGVKIGDNCYIATRAFGSEPYLIEIGNHVQITSGVKFFTHGGGWVFREEFPDLDTFGKIKIGNNVYIGNNALIMPGVSISSNIVIAAGSIVTKSFSNEGVIIGGNPAKVIGSLTELKEKLLIYNVKTKGMSYSNKRKFLEELSDEFFIKK